MADLDTVSKRRSMLQFLRPSFNTPPIPDGTIDAGDRQHFLYLYAASSVPAVADGGVWPWPRTFVRPIRRPPEPQVRERKATAHLRGLGHLIAVGRIEAMPVAASLRGPRWLLQAQTIASISATAEPMHASIRFRAAAFGALAASVALPNLEEAEELRLLGLDWR